MPAQTVIPVDLAVGPPRGLRSFLIVGDGPILVDTGVPGSAPAILAAVADAGLQPADILLIVITHAHPDHAGTAAELQAATGAPIVASALDAVSLAEGKAEPVVGRTDTAKSFAEQIAARAAAAPPGPSYAPVEATIVLAEDADHLDLDEEFGVHARVIHTPGHTPGGLSVLLGNGEVIVGDLIDRVDNGPALAGFAVDEAALVDSIARVLATEPTVVHTCHGGSFSHEQVMAAFGS